MQLAKPTKQYDDKDVDASRDEATGGFSLHALERMVSDCADQPDWRARADLCCAYYDGNQLSQKQMAMIRAEGLDERCTNLIRPVINSVLGQEAKTRTDIKIEADNDEYQDVVDALSPKLKEAERETAAHMGVSSGYASMVKAGIGWVEVARNTDPLAYPYRVEEVHRNEIWWDWRGQKGFTLDRARWVVRKRWMDLDELQAAMPEFSEILERSVTGWDAVLLSSQFLTEPDERARFLLNAMDRERRFHVARQDWASSARKQVKIYEVWYRVPASVAVLHMPGGRKMAYDPEDMRHVEAVSRGLIKVTKSVTSQIRMSLYAGPHRLLDKATTKKRFPFIPFFAFRDDEDMSPYGLIDPMISPQDEYTERRLRLQWILKAKQIDIDNDALDTTYNTIADVAQNSMRPDMVTVLNSGRKFADGVRRRNDLSMTGDQMAVMADAKQLIQDVSGRYTSSLGHAPSQVTSGIANSLLIDQGEQSMGEMNDNYAFARRAVFEELLGLIGEDHMDADLNVMVGAGRQKRVVVLNTFDPQTQAPMNMVKDADVRVGMSEVPSSPAFRMQQQQQIATIIQALAQNPQAVAVLAPAYIEASGMPDRKELADTLRRVSGLPLPADREAQAQAEEAAMQAKQKQEQMAEADFQAELQGKVAAARKTAAEATEIEQRVASQVAIAKTASETDLNAARIQEIAARIDAAMNEASNADQMVDEALSEAAA